MERKVYTVKEAAALLNVALPNMYALCKRADFPSIRISPRRIVIPAAALDTWLERQAQKA